MTNQTIPKPRRAVYFGMHSPASTFANGAWLEAEELTYPSGGMKRRAYATFPDGVNRVVKCGIPDTYFSIPAYHPTWGRGYLTVNDEQPAGKGCLQFRPYRKYDKRGKPRWKFTVPHVKYCFDNTEYRPERTGHAQYGITFETAYKRSWRVDIEAGEPL